LTKAYRINSKAATAGFTWENDEEVDRQVEAEWLELLDAKESGDADAMEHELGDMLFVLTEAGRRMGIKSSPALDAACNRFLRRFEYMESKADDSGKNFKDLSLDEKDELWEESGQVQSPRKA
jgi:ATP diphosphatase